MANERTDAPMDDQSLEEVCADFLRNALGGPDTDVAQARLRNLSAYNAIPEGDFAPPEVADRSDFVATDVADTVDGMLPQLMRMFISADNAVECEAKKQGGEGMAKSATAYLNHLFYVRNDGLNVLYDWFKDALIQKVGHVMVWAEEESEDTRQTYEGLSEDQVAALLADGDCQMVGEPAVDERGGITITVTREGKKVALKVAAVAPHEMRVDPNARWGEEPAAIGRVYLRRKFELEEEGIDTSQAGEGVEYIGNAESLAMLGHDGLDGQQEIHESHKLYECAELYLKLDRDGDGIAEWLRVGMVGDKIAVKDGELDVEQVDDHPFAEICPMPRPHAYFGDCPADRAYEPQKLRTRLVRALEDNAMLTVNGRTYVNVNAGVQIDDLLDSRPGGVVRGTAAPSEAFAPMAQPSMPQPVWQLNEWVESWRESRTLFNRYSAGTDANAMNKTKGGIEILTNKADMGLELMARFFAQGVRKMFAKLLKLAVQHQDREDWFNVNGEWVPVMPSEWKDQFNLKINVGLGQGTKEQQLARIMAMVPLQQMGMQAGVVRPEHIASTIRTAALANEFKNPDEFADAQPTGLPDPQQFQQMQQQHQQLQQENAQLKQEKASKDGELQLKAAEIDLKHRELGLKEQESAANFQLQARSAERADHETAMKGAESQQRMDKVATEDQRIDSLEQQVAAIAAFLQQLTQPQGQDGIGMDAGMDAPAAPL